MARSTSTVRYLMWASDAVSYSPIGFACVEWDPLDQLVSLPREKERVLIARMFELFVLGCTGVVIFLHGANFFFRALSRRLTPRSLSFLGVAE
ncbi:hypothetical protein ZIOFF_033922 [Zingiber officinale]|uniref:Uncharacterized protein n=1 Tax=Zingiber officinale TaxID=94328 RepID=A0A8J5GR65_ZINOF|nr:hypothetical protein ZIOFF_033922 [Zingiber officinale]